MSDEFASYLRPLDPGYWQPPSPPRRRFRGLTILVSLALFATLVGVALSTNPSTGPVPPNQAGYQWCCEAHQVAASWFVPKLLPGASGSEGVWVGLQTDSGSFFLQVGTNEFVVAGEQVYQGFWSDGPLNGSPQQLGDLEPGDLVTATLRESSQAWAVTLQDHTQGWTHGTTVAHLAPSDGDLAEWVEEDPVLVFSTKQERLDTMARTAKASMFRLEVNTAPPSLGQLEGESFTDESGTTFSPTAVDHNQFSFLPW